jgi:hypothetical protein
MLDAEIAGTSRPATHQEHRPMTHARHTVQAIPLTALAFLAAVAAVVLVGVVALTTVEPFGLGALGDDLAVSPAVVDSGIQWELERRQQYGYVDPVLDSGDQWERQRRYGFIDPIIESGDRWEEERRQQSGS